MITSPKFIQDMDKFIEKSSYENPDWFTLEFTDMGFIGKLFHNHDLSMVANYFLIFSDYMPCDLLLALLKQTIICNPEEKWVLNYFFLKIFLLKLKFL